MMRAVVSSKITNQSNVNLRPGKSTASIWQIWLLTLECAHVEIRRAEHPEPPKQVKCRKCTRGRQ